MARIAQTARMKITINDKTLDTRGITPRSPLEEQAMLIWYTAHARVAAADDMTAVNRGVQGSFNMHWHIKDLFSCTDDEARAVSSRVRQVLKKTSAARCVSVGGAGHSPVWWVSDTLPDNIITVAEWVTANHKLVGDGDAPYKPTRAEKRLSEHEAGEDRPAEPVTVVKKTGDEVTAEALLMEPEIQDTETVTVEVEGPQDGPVRQMRAAREARALLFADIRRAIKQHGPMTALECGAVLRAEQPSDERWQIDPTTFRDYLAKMAMAGQVHARLETRGERNIRQLLDRTAYFGKFSQLWSVYPNTTERHHAFNVETGLRFEARDVTDPVPVPDNRTNPLVDGQSVWASDGQDTGPITVVVNNVPAPAEPLSLRERMADMANEAWAIHNELMKQENKPEELEDLRVMNGLLEEENARLRSEVDQLRDQVQREKDRAAKVRELYS